MSPSITYCAGVIQSRPMREILMYLSYIPVPALRARLAERGCCRMSGFTTTAYLPQVDTRSLRFLKGPSC